jgi:succinate dehydrogenase/fumarate reductase flavoprotein subunit
MAQVIVVGGGLAGMSAAHTILEHGGRVVVIDKSAFCGGNSTKATSGINAAGSRAQRKLNIPDTPEIFEADTTASAAEGARPPLIKALTHQSGAAVDWLADRFGLDVSVVARLAAHSFPRTHRGKERFPGMALTYGLMEALDAEAQKPNAKVRVLNKAKVTELIRNGEEVVGVKYEKDGKTFTEMGPVIICTGGFGADFTSNSLLASIQTQWRTMEAWQKTSRAGQQNKIISQTFKDVPALLSLPTTNGPHCTGDGIKLALGVGATTYDLHAVQVHPTGLIDPSDKDNKVKFLAAEALRGSGGIIINNKGEKFCDDLGKRDYVTMRMWQDGNTPHRLILNSKARDQIAWHCEHYEGRGLMKAMTGEELAKEMGIPVSKLRETFNEYNEAAKNPEDPVKNKWGKKYFHSMPWDANDKFMVAQITPVVHYCMGGVAADEFSQVLTGSNSVIPGLYVAGEAQGGVHGVNRLGGSSLLDCVVYGRISGKSSSKYLLDKLIKTGGTGAGSLSKSAGGVSATVRVQAGGKIALELDLGGAGAAAATDANAQEAPASSGKAGFQEDDPNAAFYGKGFNGAKDAAPAAAAAAAPAASGKKSYSVDEVKKHTKDSDCWVILHNEVYDVTKFLNDHPGGKKAIMLYAGKDATTEFDMLHSKDLLARYGPEFHIGALQKGAKL